MNDRPCERFLEGGEEMKLRVVHRVNRSIAQVSFGFLLYRSTDQMLVYDANLTSDELGIPELEAGTEVTVNFRFRANLTRGQYHMACHVFHNPTNSLVSRLVPAGHLAVHETRSYAGIANLELRGSVEAAACELPAAAASCG
jgi:hypothetical protein